MARLIYGASVQARPIPAPVDLEVFENVFGLVYFEDGRINESSLRIFISQDVAYKEHSEWLATSVHEAMEAYERLRGATYEVAHTKALWCETQIARKDYWGFLKAKKLFGKIIVTLSMEGNIPEFERV